MKNFGKIKNKFNDLLVEGLGNEDLTNKKLFKSYLKNLNENEILKTQFIVYDNIENYVNEDSFMANVFIDENLNSLKKFSRKGIIEANALLASNILTEQEETKFGNEELYENITKLIFNDKKGSNVNAVVEARAFVINHIKNNKPKVVNEVIDLPSSMISTLMVDKYNEKYASLDESEKQILKVLIDSNDDEKKEVYVNTLKECINLIDTRYEGSDLETKEKLLKVKHKLLEDTATVNEDYFNNISKLVELKSSLS